jgi:predicted small secreted protein
MSKFKEAAVIIIQILAAFMLLAGCMDKCSRGINADPREPAGAW